MSRCRDLHELFNRQQRHKFPFNERDIPENGIYILFERGEAAHGGDRIVRVGTHTGDDQLRSRLKQHFIMQNKDRSIFRKNIGRCILNEHNDAFLAIWEVDQTPKEGRRTLSPEERKKQRAVEDEVTQYLQENFSFAVLPVEERERRLELESKIISTISSCNGCGPSSRWFGLHSPKEKIRKSGLWLVNELGKEPLSEEDIKEIRRRLGR